MKQTERLTHAGAEPACSTKSSFAILHGSSVGLYLGIDFQVLETAFDGDVLGSTGAKGFVENRQSRR